MRLLPSSTTGIAALAVSGLMASTLVAAAPAAAVPGTGSTVFINEIHYDNTGTDAGEAIEVAAPAGTDLSAWSLVLINGTDPTSGVGYTTTALSGIVDDQQNGYGTVSVSYPANGIQNGPNDGIALLRGGDVVQFLSYEGTVVWQGVTSTDIGVAETGGEPLGQSLQLTGSGTAAADFTWAAPAPSTFGAPNTGQIFGGDGGGDPEPEPGPQLRRISEVQGAGSVSPLAGQPVVVEAVATSVLLGDALGNQLGGFFVEEEAGDRDADPATSEGLFVFAGSQSASLDVEAGDVVRVTGSVSERFGQTQITAAADGVSIVGTAELPAAVAIDTLPGPSAAAREAAWEPLEGMRVQLSGTWSVTDNFDVHRFGELELVPGTQPLQWPTNIAPPGPGAGAIEDAIVGGLASLILDDTRDGELNPNPSQPTRVVLPAPYVDPPVTGTVRRGATLTDQVAVLSFGFNAWRLRPLGSESAITIEPADRPAAPEVSGDLTLASFNVLNYFNGNGDGTGFPTARGAETVEEFQRQEDKIVSAVTELDADVVGLIEIENDGDTPLPAIADLTDALNAAFAGERVYGYVETGRLGGDQITNAFVYDTREVRLEGWTALDDVDPFTRNTRPPLAARFTDLGTGEQVVPIVNHFKSKGSGDGANADAGDGQGASNPDRVLAATEVLEWLGTDAFFAAEDRVLITGDLNAYAFEDPIVTLENGGFTDLLDGRDPAAYTFAFFGAEGRLDHALANEAALAAVTVATPWAVNADEPRSKEYGQAFNQPELYQSDAYRSSDHDPVVVGLELGPDLPVADLAVDVVAKRDEVRAGARPLQFEVTVSNAGPDTARDVVVTHVASLPAGSRLVDVDVPRGTHFDRRTLTWTVGALAAGRSRTLELVIRTGRDASGTATLTGTVSAPVRDDVAADDADTAEVTVKPRR